jgi:hypothetical protein
MMTFERYINQRANNKRPAAKIFKSGKALQLNRAAVNEFTLNHYKSVAIYYDRSKKRIGLKFTTVMENGNASVRLSKEIVTIGIQEFINHYRLMVYAGQRIVPYFDVDEGMVIIQLNEVAPCYW